MSTEGWILKGTKLITETKKQRLKIQSRGQTLKNTIFFLKITKIIKSIYEISIKNRVFFFCKVIVGYKNKNQRSNRALKFFLKIKKF